MNPTRITGPGATKTKELLILLSTFNIIRSCNSSERKNKGTSRIIAWFLMIAIFTSCTNENNTRYLELSSDEYYEKVYASWLGQIVGLIYGLGAENKFIDQPPPSDYPYGYDYMRMDYLDGYATEVLRRYDGAFYDDDIDIEIMYVMGMEKYGVEPTYEQLSRAWKHHIRDWVWFANRKALRLMNQGYYPPISGNSELNPYWWTIDPQLINEVWAVTAPGMVQYAAEKSEWAARITSDSFGIEPTIHYGAMYAAAFFEKDIMKLIAAGNAALPENSLFAGAVNDVVEWYQTWPDDWRMSREKIVQQWYHNEPEVRRSALGAIVNGSLAISALLYGQGDFQRTIDMAVAFGFDTDCNAATMGGLLAVAHGISIIPNELLYPIEGWEKPFNDNIINRSRYDMPDLKITDLARRTADMGIGVIRKHGGSIETRDGKEYLRINADAVFIPPLELNSMPPLVFREGTSYRTRLNYSDLKSPLEWEITKNQLPQGFEFVNGIIDGEPIQTGTFNVEFTLTRGNEKVSREFVLILPGENLAPLATEILIPWQADLTRSVTEAKVKPESDPETIRNGIRGPRFYSSYNHRNTSQAMDYYGYIWDNPIKANAIILTTGWVEQHGGWFRDIAIEYQDSDGNWKEAELLYINPPMDLSELRFSRMHYAEHFFAFNDIETNALRISGLNMGMSAWNHPGKVYFTNISELEVYFIQ